MDTISRTIAEKPSIIAKKPKELVCENFGSIRRHVPPAVADLCTSGDHLNNRFPRLFSRHFEMSPMLIVEFRTRKTVPSGESAKKQFPLMSILRLIWHCDGIKDVDSSDSLVPNDLSAEPLKSLHR